MGTRETQRSRSSSSRHSSERRRCRRIASTGRRPDPLRRRRSEAGWQVLALSLMAVVVTYGILNAVIAGAMAQVQIRHCTENTIVAQALAARLAEPAPAGEGGTLGPELPEAGWSDVVVAVEGAGRFEPLGDGERAPEGAIVVRRQWRVRVEDGARLLEVSGELAAHDGSRHPRSDASLRTGRRELP